MILMGDLNAWLGGAKEKCEEDLAMALEDQDLVIMTDHFFHRRR